MKMVVTDLTRMRGGRICVAGIDLETGRRVRPMNQRLQARMLRTHGGPFEIRAIIDLGPTRDIGRAPEIEDVHFDPRKCTDGGDMPPDEFFALCERSAGDGLAPIGSNLRSMGRSLITPEGQGDCSLVLMLWPGTLRVYINGQGRLRFTFSDRTELSVTDARLYESDLETVNREQVHMLQQRLEASPDIVLSLGLGRPWRQGDAHIKHHYLQLNNIHLKVDAGWQLVTPLTAVANPLRPPAEPPSESIEPNPRGGEGVSVGADEKEPGFVEVAQRRYPNAFKKWNDLDEKRLRELALAGRSLGEIVSSLGRSADAIVGRLELIGLSVYGQPRLEDVLTFKVWSPEEEAKLSRMVAAGESYSGIAEKVGRPSASVRNHAKIRGERAKRMASADTPESAREEDHDIVASSVDDDVDVPDHIKKARGKYPRAYEPWSEEEEEQGLEAWRGGKTASEIARNLGRNPGAIRSRLKKLGVEPAPENGPESSHTYEREPKSQAQGPSPQARREAIVRQARAGAGGERGDASPRLAHAEPKQMFMLLGELLGSAAEGPKFRQALDQELALLTDRERRIIEFRFGLTEEEPMTLQEIAAIFGITRERVRQIQVRSLKRLSHPKHVARLLEAMK